MNNLKISTLLIIFLLAAIVLALGVKGYFASQPASGEPTLSAAVYLWYYLPHKPDEQPKPIEKAKYLDKYDVLYVGNPDEKTIYLTFDDCPENGHIPAILDTLEKHGASAAFFMTERYIRQHPDVVMRIADGGSLVCNHTASHISVTGLSFEQFRAELRGVEDAFREITGRSLPKFFRPPQGKFSEVTLSYAQQLGYTTVFWSFEYEDWNQGRQKSENSAFNTIMSETHPGEIVLLHSQSDTNVKILDRLMSAWEEQGYSFGSLADIRPETDVA